MKVLVCGSRHFNRYPDVERVLSGYEISEVISGNARGADRLGERYALERGIPCRTFPADWDTFGKAAGPIRNAQMLREGKPDLVVAFLAPDSRGTANMIARAKRAGVNTLVVDIALSN